MKGKFIVLTEVYERGSFFKYSDPPSAEQRKVFSSSTRGHSLRKVLVNTDHITVIKDYPSFIDKLGEETSWREEMLEEQGFTRIQLNSGSNSISSATNMVVLGNFELIMSKILEASERS